MKNAVIVDAVRTPFGKHGGSLRDLHPQDLAARPLIGLEERNGFDPAVVDDVIYGCVTPVDEQGMNVGRLAPLVAGWDDSVPGVQLNRFCGSGQQSVNFAAGMVMSGQQDVVVAGGVEHMSRVEMESDGSDDDLSETYFEHVDEKVSQGEAAERIAEKWDFTREEMDELAVDSHRRWKRAWEEGRYDDQIVPVETELAGDPVVVDEDEHPRPESTVESLSELPLAFREEGNGVHHAGNSSGIVDGASALLIASEEAAEEHGWEPLARIVETQVVGSDPVLMLTGPIPATEQLLETTDMEIEDVDLFEVNEAFASVVAAWMEETGAPWEKTNVNGGAIAHGHPLGATGGALVGKLAHELQRTGTDYALSTMCIGFGQGIATLIERV
ncbi:thiolase family protein [Halobellus rufus]|uniref:thiolase family protein n=1 Tax=Halobellus rufus TaxID=1448860 RepID=UPI000678DD5F|nr:thiolase family protein [Halobellus rufus]